MALPLIGAVLTSVLLFFSMPPWPTGWLAWVALAPLLYTTHDCKGRMAFFAFWVSGLLFWLFSLYWIPRTISTYGGMVPMPLALMALLAMSLYLGLYLAVAALLLGAGKRFGLPHWLVLPLGIVSGEYLRAHLLTGFPWLLLAHTQWSHPLTIQLSSLTGVWGVSFLLAMVNGAIIDLIFSLKTHRKKWGLVFPLLLTILTLCWGAWSLRQAPSSSKGGRGVKVALLQPNIGVHKKFDPSLVDNNTMANLQVFHRACGQHPDLVVFPETTLPFPLFQDMERSVSFLNEVSRCGVPTVVGTYHWTKRSDGYYSMNRAYLLNGYAATKGWYDKMHLVPFGEYVPLKRLFPFVTQIVGFRNGFTPGNSTRPLPFKEGGIGVLICYESIFPGIARSEVRDGAEFLVNMSNDSWFGDTLAPYQHLAAAVFRAVENRRWLMRATNSGISAFVDPWGRVVGRGGLYTREVLMHRVWPVKGETVATRSGDYLPICSLILTVLVLLLSLLTEARRRPGQNEQDR